MKQVLTNRITFCKKCNHAFIINIEGDDDTCDSCIAESELTHELINEGVFSEMKNDR
jgi:DNA-directed RNA polymerase subunit M/transcription elongation factor TFIIS